MIKGELIILLSEKKSSDIPTRSRLYSQEPIGIGTPYVESLKSYCGRLAFNHCIKTGDLIKKILIPEMNINEYQEDIRVFYDRSSRMNSCGTFTENCIDALENLTLRTDLGNLTLRKWASLFHLPYTFHNELRWCPNCLNEQQHLNQREIYEPLLWSLLQVNYCPKHKKPLKYKCPFCERRSKSFSGDYFPGFCPKCKKWLGTNNSNEKTHNIIDEKMELELYKTNALGELLSENSSNEHSLTKKELHQIIVFFVKITTWGNARDFSKIIGKSYATVSNWISGKSLPSVESFLLLSKGFNFSLKDLMLNNIQYQEIKRNGYLAIENSLKNYDFSQTKAYGPKSKEFIEKTKQKLDDIISNEYPPPSINAVKKRVNYYTMENAFPNECKVIVKKHKEYKRKISQEKEIRINRLYDEILEAMLNLYKEDKNITTTNVKRYIDKPGYFRNTKVQKWYDEIKGRIEIIE